MILTLLSLVMLAQSPIPTDWIASLGSVGVTGVVGVMLHWFMVRNERRMIAVENASNRTTRAVLLLVGSLDVHGAARQEAKDISKEIDDSERGRGSESNQ